MVNHTRVGEDNRARAMADEQNVIIKKVKKVSGHGHHGGAWKVAYADFVTAMMAFFLLMWLLNATTEDQKKGIADFFNPSIPIHKTSGGGDGPFKGDSSVSEDILTQSGRGASNERPTAERQAKGDTGVDVEEPPEDQDLVSDPKVPDYDGETRKLKALAGKLFGDSGESNLENELLKHVRTRVSDEGLVIELVDLEGIPLFEPGTARATTKMELLLQMVAQVADLVTNEIAIKGHTTGFVFPDPAYTNWELSADRANVSRAIMMAAGLEEMRLARVVGKADTLPLEDDPTDPSNRRVEIVLLRE